MAEVLTDNDIRNDDTPKLNHRFYVSDGAEKFRQFANTILPCEVMETKDINIEELG